MTEKRRCDAIDPTDEPLGMYDQPSDEVTIRDDGNGRYRAIVPQHDRHVRAAAYEFTSIEALIVWLRAFDRRLKEKRHD